MERIEVTALLSPTRRERRAQELQLQRRAEAEAIARQGIAVDEALGEADFLRALEETLQQHVAVLGERFLVLRASQVDRLAFRLRDALEAKRDADTGVIQAWTIQSQSQSQSQHPAQPRAKMGSHLQVLKLSTILREVQRLRIHQSQGFESEPSEDKAAMDERPPVEVEIFPSLRIIEALNTEVAALRHVHLFARQLRELHIEHTEVGALRQLLAPDDTGSGFAIVWRRLRKLQLNCCALPAVDASVNQLRAVKALDLGWNSIQRFEIGELTTRSLESLNLCHNELQSVPPVQSLRALRELDLAVNAISSLQGLEVLRALEVLDVSHNQLSSIAEVELLAKLPKLKRLRMEFNPMARRPDYRREVLFFLGEHVELDGQPWTAAELASMQSSRSLQISMPAKKTVNDSGWGQPVETPVFPAARTANGVAFKQSKLVMNYPLLPSKAETVGAHYAEIQNPPSLLTSQRLKRRNSESSVGGSDNASRSPGSGTEKIIDGQTLDTKQGKRAGGATVRTVGDYFRTQRDVIVSRKKSEEQATTSEEEDSDDSAAGRARTRSRKYTASDFMRDLADEESLLCDGSVIADVDLSTARSSSQSRMAKRNIGLGDLCVRVLLSAKEAAKHDLIFGIDGVTAILEIKTRELVERFVVSDSDKPVTITRWLPNLVAVGSSIHSSRAKIVTLKLRRGASDVTDVTYQIDAAATLETLLSSLVARLHQQQKGHVVSCNCMNCGALSQFACGYGEPERPSDASRVHSCLLCSSCNVREVSFKKLVAICASEGIAIPSSIPLAPPPWETLDDGFYIEEPEARGTRECVILSCIGIREVLAPSEQPLGGNSALEMHGDEWNDAIIHAMSTRG